MTRKEAHSFMWKANDRNPIISWSYHATIRNLTTDLLNRIYDEQEEQICPNCSFDHCGCSVQDSILQVDPEATFHTFGCNSFEAATKYNSLNNFDEAPSETYNNPSRNYNADSTN